jgi:hypothetical protein
LYNNFGLCLYYVVHNKRFMFHYEKKTSALCTWRIHLRSPAGGPDPDKLPRRQVSLFCLPPPPPSGKRLPFRPLPRSRSRRYPSAPLPFRVHHLSMRPTLPTGYRRLGLGRGWGEDASPWPGIIHS